MSVQTSFFYQGFGDDRNIPINFRSFDEGEQFIYVHYRLGQILYIGISNNWIARQRQHCKSAAWFSLVDEISVDEHATRDRVIDLEQNYIRRHKPHFNRDQCDGRYLSYIEFNDRLGMMFMYPDNPDMWSQDDGIARLPGPAKECERCEGGHIWISEDAVVKCDHETEVMA